MISLSLLDFPFHHISATHTILSDSNLEKNILLFVHVMLHNDSLKSVYKSIYWFS